MRIGIKGESLTERLVLMAGMIPEMAIVPFFAAVVGNAFFTAQRMGLFSLLDGESMSPDEVARRTESSPHGVRVLLEALTAFGYLQRGDGRFQVSRAYQKELSGEGAASARGMAGFAPDVARKFEGLDRAVKTGEVENFHFTPISATSWSTYLTFLKGVSGRPTKALLDRVKFASSPQRMLDIAGGPAQYSIAFCDRYPSLESVILDLPESAAEGEAEVAQAGLTGRISYVVGDFFETDWGEGYDFVLLSNILHCLTVAQCQEVIAKANAALKPGGLLVTNDVDFPGDDEEIEMLAGWSSLLYFAMMGTRTHPTPDIRRWMSDAGFTDIKKTMIRTSAQLIGRKA